MAKILGTPIDRGITPGLDDLNTWATHYAKYGQGGFQFVKTIIERDSISHERRLDKVVVVKDSNGKGLQAAYHWNGVKPDGSDGSWEEIYLSGGMVVADVDGAIETLRHTMVFGEDFDIQEAGDVGSGVLIQLSDAIKTALSNKSDGLISFGTYGYPSTFGKGDSLEFEPPLDVFSDPDKEKSFRVTIKHGHYELAKAPNFLAYIDNDTQVVGKINGSDNGHHNGTLYFGNVVCPNGSYIVIDKNNKSYGLQEADQLDPNITGGTNYLVAMRLGLKGKAPEDGYVKAYLYERKVTPYSESGYLLDVNGQPMVFEKHYKAGQDLGYIEVVGIINAKGIEEFTCHIVDNFNSDFLDIEDRTEGGSGLMIQAITKDKGKTGDALQQFEIDTAQHINFSSHYLGEDRLTLEWLSKINTPVKVGEAGQGQTMSNGLHFYNLSRMKFGIDSGNFLFQDDGVNLCDFSFGKIFSAEETQMLRGKQIKVTTTLVDKDNGYEVALVKWTGSSDQETNAIFKSRNNSIPVLESGWVKGDSGFISEDAVSGEHTQQFLFTIPTDANNYAVIIYPVQAQLPITLKLKELKIDVVKPFIGFAMKAPALVGEKHLEFNDEYKEFIQDNKGVASLRYTIGNDWTNMPMGLAGKGLADIELDTSINKVVGSQYKIGEGAIKFITDGSLGGTLDLLVWNEQGTVDQTDFRLVVADPNTGLPTGTTITTGSIAVPAKSKGSSLRINIPKTMVENGERWILQAKSVKTDGAYLQCNNSAKPMVKFKLNFKELVQANP